MAQFKSTSSDVQRLKSEAEQQLSHLASLNSDVAARREELAGLDARLVQRSNEAAKQEKTLQGQLRNKMEDAKVTAQGLETFTKLKAELNRQGMDVETLVNLAKEFRRGKRH